MDKHLVVPALLLGPLDFRRLIMANGINPQQKDILGILTDFIGRAGKITAVASPAGGIRSLSQLLGVVSTLRPGVKGEGKRVTQETISQLNPLQENVLKSVQKVHKQQVEESMAQGASGEQVLRDAGVSISPEQPTDEEGQPTDTSLALAGIQPPELAGQTAQQPQNQIVDLLNNIVSLGGFIKPSPQSRLATAQAQTLEQALRGERPMQVGELQKFILQETIKADKAGVLTPKDLFNQFEKASKVFIETRDAQARIEAAAVDPSAAGDLALIFNFMKVLDPGSTVREGEFANAQNSAGVPDRLRGLYNRIIQGKRLAPNQRKDFVDRSRKLFAAIERQQGKTIKEFQKLGRKSGIDPSVFIRDVGLVQQTQPGTRQVSGQTTSGNTFRRK